MPSLFGSRRRRRENGAPGTGATDAVRGASNEATGTAPAEDDAGVVAPDGSLRWVGSDGVVVGGEPSPKTAARPEPAQQVAPATEGLWEVIRPAAIVPEEAAREVLVELARRDLSNGGEWQSEPQLWSRYDGPMDEDGTRSPELMGTIHVTYGTPTKYEITLYRVTVTAAGVDGGWTVASLTDEALSFGGLTLAQCPRATVNAPPRPYTY
ncbi:MAG: hypothetical protein ACJ71T_16855 [Actinomycetales bacterium]